jgi:hypothetical protein
MVNHMISLITSSTTDPSYIVTTVAPFSYKAIPLFAWDNLIVIYYLSVSEI